MVSRMAAENLFPPSLSLKRALFIEPPVNKMRHLQSTVMVRRRFLGWTASLTASLLFGDIPFFLTSRVSVKEQDFVILNGWVLTREDVAASKVTIDAV